MKASSPKYQLRYPLLLGETSIWAASTVKQLNESSTSQLQTNYSATNDSFSHLEKKKKKETYNFERFEAL